MSKIFDPAFAVSLIDLTSLNDSDLFADIRKLAHDAVTPLGSVAALCVYPRFVKTAKEALSRKQVQIRVATVANFPHGGEDANAAALEVLGAIKAGADEVDVVFPWRALHEGREQPGRDLVAACRKAAGDRVLKVIIESGCLDTPERIRRASELAIQGGADFLKTSTGKVAVNANLHAAQIMLQVISESGRRVGFKAAGGIRTSSEALAYLELAQRIMGTDWVQPNHFRFGASGLLQDLLRAAGQSSTHAPVAIY